MSKWLAFSFAIFLLFGCSLGGVAPKPEVHPVSSGELPEGVFSSGQKKFLLRIEYLGPSTKEITPHEINRVRYIVATPSFEKLSSPEYRVVISYDMPSMPEMGGPWSPMVTELRNGQMEATYDMFIHGGAWEITYSLYQGAELVDVFVHKLWVIE